jgi:hypothetical protein
VKKAPRLKRRLKSKLSGKKSEASAHEERKEFNYLLTGGRAAAVETKEFKAQLES